MGSLKQELRQDYKEVLGQDCAFSTLLKHNGKIIMLGNKYVGYTFIHFLESLTNVPYRFDKRFNGILINEKGEKMCKSVIYRVRYLDRKSELDDKKIAHFLLDLGILKIIPFGSGEIGIMETQKVAQVVLEAFKKDFGVFLCGN